LYFLIICYKNVNRFLEFFPDIKITIFPTNQTLTLSPRDHTAILWNEEHSNLVRKCHFL